MTVSLVVAGVGFLLVGGGGGVSWGFLGAPGVWALGFSAAGFPITRRHPENPVGWFLMAAGAAAGVAFLGIGISEMADRLGAMMVGFWVVSVSALCSAVVFFPSGSLPSWRWRAQLGVLWTSGFLAYLVGEPGAEFAVLSGWMAPPTTISVAVSVVFQVSLSAGMFSLAARWRGSGVVERLRLKWVVYAVVALGFTGVSVEVAIANFAPAWYFAGTVASSVAILGVPAAMGVAMLRHRLFDVDIVINKTLVYGILTAMLALVYFGGVTGGTRLLVPLIGETSQISVVASTLLIAAMFVPLRRRIQSFIDRRFYRSKYDARRTLDGFSARLREETDLENLADDLLSVVRETMRPEQVGLWLRRDFDARGDRGDRIG